MSELFSSLLHKIHDQFDERVKLIKNKIKLFLELFSRKLRCKGRTDAPGKGNGMCRGIKDGEYFSMTEARGRKDYMRIRK